MIFDRSYEHRREVRFGICSANVIYNLWTILIALMFSYDPSRMNTRLCRWLDKTECSSL